jgi:hypothetical protein
VRRITPHRRPTDTSGEPDFCQSFYTQPPPAGAYGPGHRCVALSPHRPGMLVLDVVDDLIMFVEVIDRPPLD